MMVCTLCKAPLADCECPASLARKLDKERAEAIRERNELREVLRNIANTAVERDVRELAIHALENRQ